MLLLLLLCTSTFGFGWIFELNLLPLPYSHLNAEFHCPFTIAKIGHLKTHVRAEVLVLKFITLILVIIRMYWTLMSLIANMPIHIHSYLSRWAEYLLQLQSICSQVDVNLTQFGPDIAQLRTDLLSLWSFYLQCLSAHILTQDSYILLNWINNQ